MAEPSAIPPAFAEAFSQAVLAYNDWDPSIPEREMRIDGAPYTMSAVCDRVDRYTDELPANVFEVLSSYFYDMPHGHLKKKLHGSDQTYATGARCLRELIECRKTAKRSCSNRSRALPRPLVIPDVKTLKTLDDVRELMRPAHWVVQFE
jgi:hypothetical protein